MKELNSLVDELISKHIGGENFFNHLDDAVRNKNYMALLYRWSGQHYPLARVIVSGKFGKAFCEHIDNTALWVPGGLRHGEKFNIPESENKYDYVFLDDSFYSGKTRNAIKNELERIGSKLLATYVVYDGSPEEDIDVNSLYRYYDNLAR